MTNQKKFIVTAIVPVSVEVYADSPEGAKAEFDSHIQFKLKTLNDYQYLFENAYNTYSVILVRNDS